MTMPKAINRKLATAIAISLGLTVSACGGMATNRSLYSTKQPVVERTNFTLDLRTSGGGLSVPEQQRLAGWFEAMDLRYGDKIALDDPMKSGSNRSAVEAVAGRFGMLVGDTMAEFIAKIFKIIKQSFFSSGYFSF